MATVRFSHASIGDLRASAHEQGVLQFLGVQYATLTDRFAPPVLKHYPRGSQVDASRLGPQVLGTQHDADHEFQLAQQKLEYDRSAVTESATECLSLNITVPTDAHGKPVGDNLPVFAFIHGGGFQHGSANCPQYDMARFVRLSVKNKMPVVAVAINYRVGPPGFLTSKEMQVAGYKPNNGLRDQRTALLWLQQYLSGFNADPNNVTLMGESAGAVSVAFHLHSQKPLFKRAMLMSGTSLLSPGIPNFVADAIYGKAMGALSLKHLSASERIESLLKIDDAEMRAKFMQAGVAMLPVVDGEMIPVAIDWKSAWDGTIPMYGRDWCQGVIIGDCAFDGSINALRIGHRKTGIAKSFYSSLTSSLPASASTKLFKEYDLTAETDDDEAFNRVLEISNDLHFYAPTLALAANLYTEMPTYVYRFNEPNTWPGQWQGRTPHIHDLVYLLQNFNQHLSEAQRQLAEDFAGDVLEFVTGGQPWQASPSAKALKAGETSVVLDEPEQTGRRRVILDLAKEVGWDAYGKAINGWFQG